MKRRISAALIATGLAAVSGLALARQPQPIPPSTMPPLPAPPTIPTGPPVARDLTIDQLLEAVDRVQSQKADLEKQERELLAALRQKADKLKARLEKLGIGDHPPPALPVGLPK